MIKLEIPIQAIRCCMYASGKSIYRSSVPHVSTKGLLHVRGGKLKILSEPVGLTLPVFTKPLLLLRSTSVVKLIVIRSRIGWAR